MTRNMQITCKVVTMHKFSKHDIKSTKVAKRQNFKNKNLKGYNKKIVTIEYNLVCIFDIKSNS